MAHVLASSHGRCQAYLLSDGATARTFVSQRSYHKVHVFVQLAEGLLVKMEISYGSLVLLKTIILHPQALPCARP